MIHLTTFYNTYRFKGMLKKIIILVFVFIIGLFPARAAYILIPMDDSQSNHLKAYGIALLGAAAKGATKLVEMGAELNDRLYKSYNELSERGLTTAGGMTELYDSLHKVGLTSAEIEKFNKLLGENSKNLALFGGTAASGVKRFSVIANQIAGPTSKLSKEFLLIGIS